MLSYVTLNQVIKETEVNLPFNEQNGFADNFSKQVEYQRFGDVGEQASDIEKQLSALTLSGPKPEEKEAKPPITKKYFTLPHQHKDPLFAKFAAVSHSADPRIGSRNLRWGVNWEQLVCMEYSAFVNFAGNRIGQMISSEEMGALILFRLLRQLKGIKIELKRFIEAISEKPINGESIESPVSEKPINGGTIEGSSIDSAIQDLVIKACEQAKALTGTLCKNDKAECSIYAIHRTMELIGEEMRETAKLQYGFPSPIYNMPYSAKKSVNALQFAIIRGFKYFAENFYTDFYAEKSNEVKPFYSRIASWEYLHDPDVAKSKRTHWKDTWRALYDSLYNSSEERKDKERLFKECEETYTTKFKEIIVQRKENARKERGSVLGYQERLETSYNRSIEKYKPYS